MRRTTTRSRCGRFSSSERSALPLLAELGHFGDSLIRDAPDAIVYADEAGVIRFWNRGAERILGFAAAEAVVQSLDIIIPETLRARHRRAMIA
jgi:PAS domain-containing protein